MNNDRFEALMVKVTDDTASPAEREELMSWLKENPEQQQELDAHMALNALTRGWVDRLEHDLQLDAHLSTPGGKVERRLGWMLLLAALGVLAGGTLYEIWLDPEAPRWIQISFSLGAAGSLVLLYSAFRWRSADADPYSEITR